MCAWKKPVVSPTCLPARTGFLSNLQLQTSLFKVCLQKKQPKKTAFPLLPTERCLPRAFSCLLTVTADVWETSTPHQTLWTFVTLSVSKCWPTCAGPAGPNPTAAESVLECGIWAPLAAFHYSFAQNYKCNISQVLPKYNCDLQLFPWNGANCMQHSSFTSKLYDFEEDAGTKHFAFWSSDSSRHSCCWSCCDQETKTVGDGAKAKSVWMKADRNIGFLVEDRHRRPGHMTLYVTSIRYVIFTTLLRCISRSTRLKNHLMSAKTLWQHFKVFPLPFF